MSARVLRMPVQSSTPVLATWPKADKLGLKTGGKKQPATATKRPETATLEKPLLLDPKLVRKLDMTTLSREKLMTIENLIVGPKKPRPKKSGQSDWGDDGSSIGEPKVKRLSKGLNATYRVRSHSRKGLSEIFVPPPTSTGLVAPSHSHHPHLKPPETLGKRSPPGLQKDKLKLFRKPVKTPKTTILVGPAVSDAVPPPCCACGRTEQPERLHSHPARTQNRKAKAPRPPAEQENSTAIVQPKSSVRKPNPIKYRSNLRASSEIPTLAAAKRSPVLRKETFKIDPKKAEELRLPSTSPQPNSPSKSKISQIPVSRRLAKTASPTPAKTPPPAPLPAAHVVHSPTSSPAKIDRPDSSSPRRPRTVVCYLCMREFGTASLPLHEPHCLQRWARENSELPPHLQRAAPRKPDRPLSPGEWNKFAYASAQASLVPCEKCGRTFLPNRLPAHMKACIGTKRSTASVVVIQKEWENGELKERRTEPCYLCGWMFPPDELANHEETCLIKWQTGNDQLPPEQRHPLPLKTGQASPPPGATAPPPAPAPHCGTRSPSRRRTSTCYLCGREFGSASIRIHEPQCLKKWRAENDKLPAERRRQEPHKPEMVFTPDGRVDETATDDLFWQSHIVQLVPCSKCSRTFNPDRVIVHERACKGPQQKH